MATTRVVFLTGCLTMLLMVGPCPAAEPSVTTNAPVKIIFDTDCGNDVDDVLALATLHALQTRGACELLAVTISIPDENAGPFVDAINTFYGRADIPIGVIRTGKNEPSKYLPLARKLDSGKLRYPHDLQRSSDAPVATEVLRKILSESGDQSVVLVQVGYFSNLAALLDTAADKHSKLNGRDLVKQKVKMLSIMAGAFQTIHNNNHYSEYNVVQDLPAAQKLAKEWPTPIVWSGFEIGIAAAYPADSIERDFKYVPHHPVAEAYYLYEPPPHNRPTWDLTSALYAVLPDRGYFDLSPAGIVTIENDGFSHFTPAENGRDRFLIMDEMKAARVREALLQLTSQPPLRR
jgi:hypothetical protein